MNTQVSQLRYQSGSAQTQKDNGLGNLLSFIQCYQEYFQKINAVIA
jgi:hypothetical protein